MKLRNLYAEYFANFVTSGDLVKIDKISLSGVKVLYDRFVTHNRLAKVWVICALPVHYDRNLTELIRSETFSNFPDIKTIVHFVSTPVAVNIRENMFLRQFERVNKQYNEVKDFYDSLDEKDKLVGISEVDPDTGRKIHFSAENVERITDEYDSYSYIYSQTSSGHLFSNTVYFVQASASTKREMKLYQKFLENLFTGEKLLFKEIHGSIGSYLDNYCPATRLQSGAKKYASMLMSDENLSGLVPVKTKGLMGGKGVMLGADRQSGLPFIQNFFDSGTAQVIMLLGKTGCGKTYCAFFIALGLAALNVHFSAIDIKGHEWCKILQYVNGVEFQMGGSSSKFINTMRLDDLDCGIGSADAEEAFQSAVNSTIGLFEVIVNLKEDEGNPVDLHTILSQAVLKVYRSNGVIDDNSHTFSKTRDFWYSDVLNVVSSLRNSSSYNEQYKTLCDLIITRCSPYFMPEGMYSSAFQEEITLQEVLEQPCTIFSFNKNQGETLSILDNLRVYMVQAIDGKKQYMRKKKKLHTAAFYEELQRCGSFGNLVEEICQKVTGSRSNNVMIFLLFNVLSVLDNKQFNAIKSNITTKIVGKVEDEDIKILTNEYGCQGIEKYLKAISSNIEGKFTHCFAIQYDTGVDVDKTIFKTVMPPEMSDNFNTRDRMSI